MDPEGSGWIRMVLLIDSWGSWWISMFSMKDLCLYKVNNICLDEIYLNWSHKIQKMGLWWVKMDSVLSRWFLVGPNETLWVEIYPVSGMILFGPDGSLLVRMNSDWSRWILIGPDGPGWVQTDHDGYQCVQIDPDRFRRILKGPGGFCYIKMVPGGSKWILMGLDGSWLVQMDPD